MQMGHHLVGIGARVYHQAIAALGHALAPRQLGGQEDAAAHQLLVLRAQFGQGRDVRFGYDEDMFGRLRIDIPDGDDILILVHNLGRYLASGDAAEDALSNNYRPSSRATSSRWNSASP